MDSSSQQDAGTASCTSPLLKWDSNKVCLYTKVVDGNLVYVLISVDDIVVGCKLEAETLKVYNELKKIFDITCVGDLTFFLGMQIERKNGTYSISLSSYIDQLAHRLGMQQAKSANTPMDCAASSWISRRQSSITLSSMEAEYTALSEAWLEAIWLRRLQRFGLCAEECNGNSEANQSCIAFVRSERQSRRSKHIETREHFVKKSARRKTSSFSTVKRKK
ncbi:uncharacterized protein LOC129741370 [Uranotaenia lowii]|uniref:uncharacterized protein LOC129741370 n=1 Tax=Uranotaenia lowii TaxID=190385 RepID=UPI0024797A85|nr:uncharacterized protein LOC129741370 [Uranotaenia lowii]